jgi:hypothetical protein
LEESPSISIELDAPDTILPRKLTRRRLFAGTAGAMAVAAGWQRTIVAQEATPEPGFMAPEFSDAEVDDVIVALATAGIAVYEQPYSPLPIVPLANYGPVSLLRSQVRAMVLEATNQSGILGGDLDDLVTPPEASDGTPVPAESESALVADAVPPSALLAAYVAGVDSPGAEIARRFMPIPDVAEPENVVYPGLVLTLFAAEVARDNVEASSAGIVGPIGAGGVRAFVAQTGICSTVQGFIDRTLNSLFNALQVDLGSSLPGRILGGVINILLGGAKKAIREAIQQIIAPVMDVIKTIAGVLGMASMIVSAIRPWSLRMTPNPVATRLAVGAEAPIPGDIQCKIDLGGLDEWPADVADCAAQSGTPLPPLKPAGAACTWTIAQSRFPVPLVATKEPPGVLDDNGVATFSYVTLSEDVETAKGDPLLGWVRVTLNVARPELDRLRQTLSNLLFAQLPALVAQFVRPILGPTVDSLLAKLQSFTDSKSSTTIQVLYHQKKDDPTPEPEPETNVPATINVAFEPVAEAPFPVYLILDAATCDGSNWEGTLQIVFKVDTEVVTLDLDQTRPIEWSFDNGDSSTANAGPFQAPLRYTAGGSDNYSVTTRLDISRTQDDDGGTESMTFGIEATVAIGGMRETNQITGASNLGVPIPVTSGNANC